MKNIYVLRNRLISSYNDPFFKELDGEAIKKEYYKFCVLEKDAALKNHLNECELYFIGTFNDESAEIQLLDKPEYICDLSTFFSKEN